MRSDVEVRLGPGDRERLEAVLADRNSAQKHVWRARIILATAEGCGTTEIMRRAGVSKPSVWRWQRRFMEAGVDGLLRDKTRKPGKAPVAGPVVARLIERTLGEPPGEMTHWTSRAMAKVTGLAISTVQKIWRAHGLAPHRLRTFKLSRDPQFASKVRDVALRRSAGPCRCPLGRREEPDPGARPHPARLADEEGTSRHDDPRLHPPRHHDLVRRPERARRPGDRAVRAAPPPPGVPALPQPPRARHPGRQAGPCRARQLRQPHASQGPGRARSPPALDLPLHADLGFLPQCRRGLLRQAHPAPPATWRIPLAGRSQAAINRYPAEHNHNPKPFVWTADPQAIIAAASRGYQVLDSIH